MYTLALIATLALHVIVNIQCYMIYGRFQTLLLPRVTYVYLVIGKHKRKLAVSTIKYVRKKAQLTCYRQKLNQQKMRNVFLETGSI